MDRWGPRSFHYVNYFDSFDGGHPRAFIPREREQREWQSMEEINNYLLAHAEVYDLVRRLGPGKAVFVMLDEESEARAAQLGVEIAHPSADLRHRIDSIFLTTRIGNEAGVPSVPNALGRATWQPPHTALPPLG